MAWSDAAAFNCKYLQKCNRTYFKESGEINIYSLTTLKFQISKNKPSVYEQLDKT